MVNIYKAIIEDICDKLADQVGVNDYGYDLHNSLCNQDYFIIGTFYAKKFLGDHAFDAIKTIIDYEQSNFGEVTTDTSEPERVVNMLVYIIGEQILTESDHLASSWDRRLDEDDLAEISSEILNVSPAMLSQTA